MLVRCSSRRVPDLRRAEEAGTKVRYREGGRWVGVLFNFRARSRLETVGFFRWRK